MAAVVPVIKVVGIALSVKSAVEGIKDGNLLQAVVGAVGAYYGVTNFAAAGAEQAAGSIAQSGTAEGAQIAAETAGASTQDQIAAQLSTAGANQATQSTAQQGLLQEGLNQTTTGLTDTALAAPTLAETGTSYLDNVTQVGGGGITDLGNNVGKGLLENASNDNFFEQVLSFAKENPDVTNTGLQLGGSYLMAKAKEDEREDLLKEERRRYNRRGQVPGNVQRLSFNPKSSPY